MKKIYFSSKKGKDKFALVDDEDYVKVMEFAPWYYYNGYANTSKYIKGSGKKNQKSKKYYIHRIVMNAPSGLQVDHIDGDRLNNCKNNLRICTSQQNTWNSKSYGNVSKYKGVSKNARSNENPWRASVRSNGIFYRLGSFRTEEEAALAYNEKAKELFGEFAWLNKII